MNRIMGRAKILLVLILVLALGTGLFVGEYFVKAGDWVMFAGSPHIYNAGNLGCGVVTDRNGVLLMDLTGSRVYAQNVQLRMSVLHWLGDRQGNISASALPHYAEEITGFNPINGVYAYGGTGGQVSLTLSAQLQIPPPCLSLSLSNTPDPSQYHKPLLRAHKVRGLHYLN